MAVLRQWACEESTPRYGAICSLDLQLIVFFKGFLFAHRFIAFNGVLIVFSSVSWIFQTFSSFVSHVVQSIRMVAVESWTWSAAEEFGQAVAEEAELACLVLLDGASRPLPLLLRSSEAWKHHGVAVKTPKVLWVEGFLQRFSALLSACQQRLEARFLSTFSF